MFMNPLPWVRSSQMHQEETGVMYLVPRLCIGERQDIKAPINSESFLVKEKAIHLIPAAFGGGDKSTRVFSEDNPSPSRLINWIKFHTFQAVLTAVNLN